MQVGAFEFRSSPHSKGVAGGVGLFDFFRNTFLFWISGDTSGPPAFGIGVASPSSCLHIAGALAAPCPTAAKTAAYTLGIADETVKADATGGAFTITLPDATACPGRMYTVKRMNSGGNAVTVGTTSSQTIDGATTYSLASQYSTLNVQSDGANYVITGKI